MVTTTTGTNNSGTTTPPTVPTQGQNNSNNNNDQATPRVSSRLSSSQKLSNSISRRVHREIRFGDYVLGSTLGQGEFGKVKLGWRKDGKQPEQVAIKLIRKDTVPPKSNRETKVFREINALKILSHPNIVHLEQVIQNDKYIGIVLEYASGGELFDHILTHRYLKDSVACRLFSQLVSGVHYLHSKGIVHRDLKLENLLLDKHKNIIITDFGFANSFKASADGSIYDLMSTSCGSPCYAAPELVVSESKYVGQKVDVWSCGVILYAMLAGYLPFDDDPANPDGDNITQLYKYITTTPLTFPEYIQPMPRDLLRKILVPDPDKRTELNTVRSHPWLSSHAHFLSVTPQEWDRSYHVSTNKPYVNQPPQSNTGSNNNNNKSQLNRSQSVQVKSTTNYHAPHHSSSAASSSNLHHEPQTQQQQPSLPPQQVPASYNPQYLQPQNMDYYNEGYHSRRHSVQTGYTKGIPHSTTNTGGLKPEQQQPSDKDDVVQSLDIPDNTDNNNNNNLTNTTTTSHNNNSNTNIPPAISENATSNGPQQLSMQSTTTRLPGARKPRPTSYQPTSGSSNFAFSSSNNNSETSFLAVREESSPFQLPMSSEPRVGLNHDSALPAEISRPESFKSNQSAAALTKIGSQEGEEEKKKATEAKPIESDSNNNNIVREDSNTKPVEKTPTKQQQQKTHHRRGTANSISYGADRFFSKILGTNSPNSSKQSSQQTAPTHSRRHSMMPTGSENMNNNNTTKSDHRKRFSIMGTFGSSSSSTSPTMITNDDSQNTIVEDKTASESSVVLVNKTNSNDLKQSTPRKVLEPSAGDALNRQHNTASSATKKSDDKNTVSSKEKEQSAARKVVDFFKRRSRMV